jgi:hypothetical protein
LMRMLGFPRLFFESGSARADLHATQFSAPSIAHLIFGVPDEDPEPMKTTSRDILAL